MWNLTVRNIGGIRSGEATLMDGYNVIQATNFRGKSSLIAALRTVIGASGQYGDHPLTEGTREGTVTLDTGDDQYTVTLERTGRNTVTRSGTPYLADTTDQVCARLFACLDEDNPIRTAVRNGEDLTELLQAPLDVENIDSQIEALKREKRDIEAQITEAERAGEQLPTVQETVTNLQSQLEELRRRRDELAEEEPNKRRIEELSDEISAKSGALANITDDISRLETEIERKQDRLSRKEAEIAAFDVPDELDDSHDAKAMHDQIDALSRQIDLIEDLYRANQNVVESGDLDAITDVDRSVTADEVDCWVCGQQTTRDEITEHISQLQSKTAALRDRKNEVEAELAEREERQREIRQQRQKREQLEQEVKRLKADIDEKRGSLQDKRERKSELEADIETLREELENAEEEYNEELTDVKTEIRTAESKLQDSREKLETLEEQYAELETLEPRLEEVQSELSALRNRKKATQETLKERFNTIIADIIEAFEPGFSSARLVLKTDDRGEVESIDLEIARDIDDAGRQTSVATLSEGEVELIGLVVALAGYHAFEVDSKSPYILIDGISQLAAEHLRRVANYLDDHSDILVTTAYPEAGSFDAHVIDPDEWEVVSDAAVSGD